MITCYRSKLELLEDSVAGRTVVHLGAVGETCGSIEQRVAAAPASIHGFLTRVSSGCVGIDTAEDVIRTLQDRQVFTNLICHDATQLSREDIPLDRIDVVVAGDIIEHLSNPGALLDAARRIADDTTELVVTTPNGFGLSRLARYLMGANVEGTDHVCSFNIWSLRNLLVAHGWKPTFAATCYQPSAASLNNSLAFRLGALAFRALPRAGGTLFVTSRHS